MLVTLGMDTLSNKLQPSNARYPILVTFGIVTLASEPQFWNASFPMLVTLEGIDTLWSEVATENWTILTTGTEQLKS